MQRLLPYGDSNFENIITQNSYYIDKTKYIEKLERVKWPVFLRPRRFGKTLFTETLRWYYDIKAKDRFEELFGKLYIGKNPTPNHNKYFFLKLDFSGMSAWSESEVDFVKKQFDKSVSIKIKYFLQYYRNELNITDNELAVFEEQFQYNASGALKKAIEAADSVSGQMFIAIDEYDSLTNAMAIYYKDATEKENEYLNILKKGGFFRSFFEAIKSGTSTAIAQTYITGILPITIADMNSGYNIASWITFNPDFSEMLGITHNEFAGLLKMVHKDYAFDVVSKQEVANMAKKYYNGYKFRPEGQPVYNPMMALYLLRELSGNRLPDILADNNLRIDYNQIAYIFGNNTETRDEVIKSITDDKAWQHGFTLNISFDMDAYKNGKYIAEGLFYSGILTYGEYRDELRIPNLVTYEFVLSYFNRIMEFNESSILIGKILHPYSFTGDVVAMIDLFFEKVIQNYPGDFFRNANESFYHGLLFYVLWNQLYKDAYEVLPEYPLTNGQADLMVRSLDGARVRCVLKDLFELKQVPKSASDAQFEAKLNEARNDMKKYLTGAFANWRGVVVCFRGNKDYKVEIMKNE